MTRELKDKWVKALRSGKYKQMTTSLWGTENHRCANGVLLEVCDVGDWETVWYGTVFVDDDGHTSLCHVHTGTAKKIGLKPEI